MNIGRYLSGESQHIGTSRVSAADNSDKLQRPHDLMDKADAEILARVKRQLTTLRQQLETAQSEIRKMALDHLAAEEQSDEKLAEAEKYKADAERYRWLRSENDGWVSPWHVKGPSGFIPLNLDAAIDAAIAAGRKV